MYEEEQEPKITPPVMVPVGPGWYMAELSAGIKLGDGSQTGINEKLDPRDDPTVETHTWGETNGRCPVFAVIRLDGGYYHYVFHAWGEGGLIEESSFEEDNHIGPFHEQYRPEPETFDNDLLRLRSRVLVKSLQGHMQVLTLGLLIRSDYELTIKRLHRVFKREGYPERLWMAGYDIEYQRGEYRTDMYIADGLVRSYERKPVSPYAVEFSRKLIPDKNHTAEQEAA